nr:uncharacterized protein LOC120976476 [Aegilops tauschii subsp. strangulata]
MPLDPGAGRLTLQPPFGSSSAAANAGAPLLPRQPRTQALDPCSPSSSTSLGAQLPSPAVAVAIVDSQAVEEHEDPSSSATTMQRTRSLFPAQVYKTPCLVGEQQHQGC